MDYRNLTQYLSRYASDDARNIPTSLFSTHTYQLGLCLPLRGETIEDVETVFEHLGKAAEYTGKRLLIVAVVNGTPQLETHYRQANQALLARRFLSNPQRQDHFLLDHLNPFVSVLWIDRSEQFPFSEKEGVGLARKIGCDVLCRLIETGTLVTPWLWTTDADARIPFDYFSIPKESGSAYHYPYRHDVTQFEGSLALVFYEIHLRYYFLGLKWAHSPYSYPAIGSCLAIDPHSYVVVRGFPNRMAGEDFHLLSKLSKTGRVLYGTQSPIYLKGRYSSRVPFGTGQSTINIQSQLNQGLPFTLYDPRSFRILKDFLRCSTCFLKTDPISPSLLIRLFHELASEEPGVSHAIDDLQLEALLKDCHEARDSHQERLLQFNSRFDALKTLRLIHNLEKFTWPKTGWEEAILNAPFLSSHSHHADPRKVLQTLVEQEEGGTAISSPAEDDG